MNILMILTLFSNVISGYVFVYLLKYAGSQLSIINIVELTAYILLMNRLGRFIAISFELKKSNFFMKYDHIIFSISLFISIALLTFSKIKPSGISAFFLGLGMSGATIAQRWRISEFKSDKINIRYIIVSTIAWGIGVLIPNWFPSHQNFFQIMALLLSISLIILSFIQLKQISIEVFSTQLPTAHSDNLGYDMYTVNLSSKYILIWNFVFSVFLVSYAASIFNSILFTELKRNLNLTDFQISLFLIITILGSCILFFVKSKNNLKKIPIKFSLFNLLFICCICVLFLVPNISSVYITMLFIGLTNSISSMYQMEYVTSIDSNVVTFKVLHVFSEFASVIAGLFFYLLMQNQVSIQANLMGSFILGVFMYGLSIFSVALVERNKFRIRIANGGDLEFLINLYRECKDSNIGQSEFPECRKIFFKKNENVLILLDPPLDGFTEFHYYIVETMDGLPIACVTNLRNDKHHEELGMLVRKEYRARGLGKKTLSKIVELRKSYASRITGLIAESNVACIKASSFAGARIIGNTKYEGFSTLFLNVEFYNKDIL